MNDKKVYVGNLSFQTTEEGLKSEFGSDHAIADLRLITDRETGRSKGFAFITFETQDGVDEALKRNGADLDGRNVRVNIAEDRRR